MMTKKNFIMFAHIMAEPTKGLSADAWRDLIISDMEDYFASDNIHFDRNRFETFVREQIEINKRAAELDAKG